MPKFDESQMKSALSAIREARRKSSSVQQVDPSERARILANRRAIEKLVASAYAKAGLEIEQFDKILAQNQTELRRISEKQRADAVKFASSIKDTLRYGVENRRKTLDHLTTITSSFAPNYVLLNAPFLIWTTPGMFFDNSQTVPSNSWAKVKVQSEHPLKPSGSEDLSFYFLWENPSDRYAVANVDAYLVLNGFLQADAPGGFFAGDRRSTVSVKASFYLLEWWNQPPTQPSWQVDQSRDALSVSAYAGDMFDDYHIASDSVFRGYDLRYEFFLIPPNGVVVFEVTMNVSYGAGQDNGGHGSILADFDSGDLEVICPAVLVAVLT